MTQFLDDSYTLTHCYLVIIFFPWVENYLQKKSSVYHPDILTFMTDELISSPLGDADG